MRRAFVIAVCLAALYAPAPAHAALLDRILPWVTKSLRTEGLSIHWGGTLTADTVELRDTTGTYATFHGVKLVWSPLALLHKHLLIDSLTANDGDVARLPKSSEGSSGSGSPSKLTVRALQVGKLILEKPLAGAASTLHVDASGSRDGATMQGRLDAERLDGTGTYDLVGRIGTDGITAHVTAKEGAGGLIATASGLPDIGAIDLSAAISGPDQALATQVALSAGPLHATASGQVDMTDHTIALHMDANAPAMAPRAGLAWQAVSLKADVKGPFAAPDVTAALRAEGLKAEGGGAGTVVLHATGNKGDVRLTGQLDGVTLPGKQPDILAAAPIQLDAEAYLSEPGRPVRFALHHPLLEASGTAQIDTEQGTLDATFPDLGAIAAEVGETLQGRATLHLATARAQSGAIALDLTGTLGIAGGPGPVPALVGGAATIEAAAQVKGEAMTLSHLAFNGQDLSLSASGAISASAVDLAFNGALPRLGPVDPRLAGGLRLDGHVSGPTTDLALSTTVTGEMNLEGQTSGPFTAHLDAHGLPSTPTGTLTVQGALLSAPIDIALSGGKSADGGVRMRITRADWKSLDAAGAVSLPAGATLPQGQLHLAIGRLADFAPLIGRPLTGSLTAALDATTPVWRVEAKAANVGAPGTASIAKAALKLTLQHPERDPSVDGTLNLDGVKSGRVSGSLRLAANGPADALGLTLAADLANLDGAPAKLAGRGSADAHARQLTLASFNGTWKGQDIRLLAPVRLGFAQGVTIGDLRLGLRQALIEVNGTVGQTLDLTARLRNVPASLASLVSPTLALSGTLNADARLGGTPAAPTGTVRAQATTLRMDTATGRALPAADLTATADLQGTTARLNLQATAGSSHLTVAGTAGLSLTAPLNLRADANVDIAQAGALLAPGERAAGRMTFAAAITGTAARPSGTVRANAAGVRLLNGPGAALPPASVTAVALLQGRVARIETTLTAGASHLAVAGTAGLSQDGPLDLHATGAIDLALADPVLQAGGQAVRGRLGIDATVRGTLAAPRLEGGATLTGGDIRDYAAGVHLSAVSARLDASGDTLRVVAFTARAGNGTLGAQGSIGLLAPSLPIDLTITARNASPIESDLLTATLGANLSIRGQLEGAVTLGGRIDVSRAVVQVPDRLPASVVTIPVRVVGAPPPRPAATRTVLANIGLDLTIAAPGQIYVRGRGLNAELAGTVHIGGTSNAIRSSGGFHLVRGSFNLVGNTLTFDHGDIDFGGASLTDPALHLVATSVGSNMVATLTVAGTARDPKIELSSVPPLPQDQILAQLLFHTNAGALGPFQLASIAAGLAEISGQGGALTNPLQGLQNALGLDQLGVGTGANGQPTLQAGRYLTRRIYVGAQQAASGGGAQASVQVDLTKGLKLNATAGNGEATSAIGATGASNGASVGLTYQFEY